jgi:glycosyltransferase involved in cell wall biosynthesis
MRDNRIKLLYVIPRLARAGTERHLIGLANNLDKEIFDVSVCCLFDLGKVDEADIKDIRVICLCRRNIYDLRIIIDLYKFIKKGKFDIVHAYLFGFHYLALIPARLAGVRVTLSSRRELATWKRFYHRLLENLGNLFADKVIACSNAAMRFSLETENISSDRIVTIYNGINLKNFSPGAKSELLLKEFGLSAYDMVIGMVSNFSGGKGHDILLKAICKVKEVFPRIKCLLVGGGRLRVDYEKMSKRLDLGQNLIFAGQRDDIPELLRLMEVFVFSSQIEGLPNAILEAMACGLPVVATDSGGTPEIVENGKNGILVNPHDYLGMAKATIRLLNDRNLRTNMGEAGRDSIEVKFSLDKMLKNYADLYRSLVPPNS